MAGDRYNQFGTGSSSGFEGGERHATVVQRNIRDVYENNFEKGLGSSAHQRVLNGQTAEHRRVAAAQGADLVQKYDAFGNNSFSSADNPWAAFFGAPASPWKTTSYDKYDRHNYNLPEAYVGKSEQLTATVDELIYSDENYYTTVLLPMSFTDQLHITWDKWEFNEHFTGIIPEQGVSRLVSSHRETQSESFLRRGLAAMWEHGFMSTPQGRADYFLTLAQIARAVTETIQFGVIYAYLTCQNYTKQWQEKHGYFRKDTLKQLLQRQNFMWAIVVKMENGMEKLDAQIIEWMNDHRSSADTWLLPPKPAIYLRLVPAEKVYYYLAGPEGPNRVNDVVTSGRPHESNAPNKRTQDIVEPYAVFKKNDVYLTRSYHVDKTGPIDLMTRTSSMGEFFKIVPAINSFDYRNDYLTNYTDTRIYDEDNDTGYTVSMREALRNCQVFNEDGSARQLNNLVDQLDSMDLKQCFFLRPIVGADGSERFVPIKYMGDIDAAFFRPEDAGNLAATAVRSLFPDKAEREALTRRLNAGRVFVNGMDELPTFAALRGVNARAELRDLADAIDTIVTELAVIFGNTDNAFLAGGAQTLYENVMRKNAIPVVVVQGGINNNEGGIAPAQSLIDSEAYGLTVGAIASATRVPQQHKNAWAQLKARVGAGGDLTAKTHANIGAILDVLDATPALSGAANAEEWSAWSNGMRVELNKKAASANIGAGMGGAPRGPEKIVYVNRNSPGLRDGTYRVASGVDVNATGFMATPMARACIAAEMSASGPSSSYGRQQKQTQFGGDLQDLFDDGDEIGNLFGAGETMRKNIGALDSHQTWKPADMVIGEETFNVRMRNFGRNINELSKVPMDTLTSIIAHLYYGSPWHRDTLENLMTHNILTPIGFLGFRVGLYQMALGIKCKKGAETGRTYFGHSSFMLADDAAVGIHYGNFHHYGKSVIHNPENVFVAYDIFPNAALGGMGSRPYSSREQYDPSQLIFAADIFYVMIPYRETVFDSVMSMAGRFYTYLDRGMLDDEDPANRALHYSTAAFYNRVWGWYSEENVQVELDEPMYRMTNAAHDLTVWQGAQGTYNPRTSEFNKNIIRCKSGWGQHTAEGCKASRDGQMERVPIVPHGVLGF